MATQTHRIETTTSAPTTCQHYWVLPASGNRMDGVCKLCGAQRKFQQKTEEHVWEEERNADAAYWNTTDSRVLSDLVDRAVA